MKYVTTRILYKLHITKTSKHHLICVYIFCCYQLRPFKELIKLIALFMLIIEFSFIDNVKSNISVGKSLTYRNTSINHILNDTKISMTFKVSLKKLFNMVT